MNDSPDKAGKERKLATGGQCMQNGRNPQNVPEEPEGVALGKYLATCGVASRRHSVELVKEQHITVNGAVESNPARRILPADIVVYDGKRIMPPAKRHCVMLNKPRGYVCTSEDVHAKKKALDLIQLPGAPRLYSAGRLDKDSEGLIIFSDDGEFVNALTHPSHGICKTYEVSLEYELTERDVFRMKTGIQDEGELLRVLHVRYVGGNKYEFILGEGKNREIRRILTALRNRALRLKRVAVGGLRLGSLPTGLWRELTEAEQNLALGQE